MGVTRHRSVRAAIVAVSLALVAACGARVDESQISAIQRTSGANGVQTGGDVDAASADTGDGTSYASGDTTVTTSATDTSDGGGGPTTTLPPGGNGGATDVGVTGDSISLGGVFTMSGPVPGLFTGAAIGAQAFLAYQNSIGGVYGRKLKLDVRDDQFDTGQNRAQTVDLIRKAFALVGSFSLYDDAAVKQIEEAGMPDVQVPLTVGLQNSPANFSVNPVKRGSPTGPWNLLKEKFPQAITAVGGIYGDVPAAKDNYLNVKATMESLGYKFVYERGYQPTETDFTADVVRMRSAGVKFFFTSGDVKTVARIAKAMAGQGFKPDAFTVFGPGYDSTTVPLGGEAVEGIINITMQAMYLGEDAPFNPEVRLFNEWLQKVKPGYRPDLFAAYGWGSTRLFVKALQDAGSSPTRANVMAALRKIDSFSGEGMFPEAGPASKRPAVCFLLVTIKGGKFERWNSPPPGFNCANTQFFVRK